jgi:hypothetical protein
MKPIMPNSRWMYELLLNVYPRELRSRFATDMVEVFEDFLAEAALERGAVGIVSLWCTAVWELVSIGVPSRLKSTGVIAGTLSFLVSTAIAWVFFHAVG